MAKINLAHPNPSEKTRPICQRRLAFAYCS